MNERLFFAVYKLPSIFVISLIVAASLFLTLFVQGCIKVVSTQGIAAQPAPAYYSNNPNAVAAGTEEAVHVLKQDLGTAWRVTRGGLGYAASSVAGGVKVIATVAGAGAQAAARGIGTGIMFTVKTVASTVVFVLRIPINLFGVISNTQVVGAVIEPSDQSQVPIIDPNDPELLAALQALPAQTAGHPTEPPVQEAAWPMHGKITTHFGEQGRFYRTAHTGIDISDGNRSGVTPVKAFRRGNVLTTARNNGLGNHVIVDHGNGVTSVYAHLSSISVQPGQGVDANTTLGLQGSTGVSTGPHLHFEIRINGQATDPRPFIAGQP